MHYEITTKRLLLRPLKLSDTDTVHEYASDKENTRFMIFLPNSTVKETEDFLRGAEEEWKKDNPEFFEFAVVLDGRQIGAVSAYLDENRECAEFGWILNKRYQHNGYAFEAALALKDFVINILHVKRIVAHCDARNAPSYRLMEKIGLTLESDGAPRVYPKTGETATERTYSLNVK